MDERPVRIKKKKQKTLPCVKAVQNMNGNSSHPIEMN